jgi:hypothetical protein
MANITGQAGSLGVCLLAVCGVMAGARADGSRINPYASVAWQS